MSTVSTIKMTASQYLHLGEDPPGVRLELVNGEVAVSPSAVPDHSYIEKMLSLILLQHIRQHNLGRLYGDVDTLLGEYDVRRPDLIYFRTERLNLVGQRAIEGPPDLCVEIISPSSAAIDRHDKFHQYETAGVAHYWIVDPAGRTIEAFQLCGGRYMPAGKGADNENVTLPPFPLLVIPLGEIWPPRR